MFNHNLEERVKRLEEELCYCHKDIANLCSIIENLKSPEIHTHYTLITENVTCTACNPNNTDNLDELT